MLEALCDDLNTPLVLSVMHTLADAAMTGDRDAASGLRAAGSILGLLQQSPSAWFQAPTEPARGSGAVSGAAPFVDAVVNYYQTDPISRASPTMAECAATFAQPMPQAAE